MKSLSLIIALSLCLSCANAQKVKNYPTDIPKREFRGAWMQCVNGCYLGKSMSQIRTMMRNQLDALKRAGINAIFFQVRPEGDALYKSNFEPWSRFLTGQQGTPPEDGWDPLLWMIDQCHSRGMECHAWINPYRMKTKTTNELAVTHPAIKHPDWIVKYGDLFILNPALKQARDYTCIIAQDIIENYDVDGIHIDDYFYPYPETGIIFDDERFFKQDNRGFSDIADWRRDNVNLLVKQLHEMVRHVKPWVKFGISPFGIYRNDKSGVNSKFGSATNGLQNYDQLYADVVKWQQEGWVDYIIPQVYWNFGNKAADYGILLNWWNDYCNNRPVFIGQDIERTVKEEDPNNPGHHQMEAKYDLQRKLPHIQGSCQWYAAAVEQNPGNYATVLEQKYHRFAALQPEMKFISAKKPAKPKGLKVETNGKLTTLKWNKDNAKDEMKRAIWYVVYDFKTGQEINIGDPTHIRTITRDNSVTLAGDFSSHTIVLTALNHIHNESKPAIINIK